MRHIFAAALLLAATPAAAQWRFAENTDPITDREQLHGELPGKAGSSFFFGCAQIDDRGTWGIMSGLQLPGGGYSEQMLEVTLRFDRGALESRTFELTDTGVLRVGANDASDLLLQVTDANILAFEAIVDGRRYVDEFRPRDDDNDARIRLLESVARCHGQGS